MRSECNPGKGGNGGSGIIAFLPVRRHDLTCLLPGRVRDKGEASSMRCAEPDPSRAGHLKVPASWRALGVSCPASPVEAPVRSACGKRMEPADLFASHGVHGGDRLAVRPQLRQLLSIDAAQRRREPVGCRLDVVLRRHWSSCLDGKARCRTALDYRNARFRNPLPALRVVKSGPAERSQ